MSRSSYGLTALVVVLALLPLALPNPFYYDVAIRIAINACVAIGLNLLIGYTGQISLGHAGFFGIGAYVSAILTTQFGWPPALAMVAGAAGTGLLAFVVARPILKLKGHYLAMAMGGLGSGVGAVVGGLLLGAVEAMTAGYISSAYKDAMPFVLILLILFFRPQGLFGKKTTDRV
ncbi:MAG: hypothetical protein E6H52_03375 [Betaproteobacteria bacterium]|nr:MAG: hypothetical protein E6H52_03375 [Betaproteobacteria bacterium]